MRVSIIFLLILLAVCIGVDCYIYHRLPESGRKGPTLRKLYASSSVLFQLMLIAGMIVPARHGDNVVLATKMWLLFGYATIYLPKILWMLLDLLSGIPKLLKGRRIKGVTIGYTALCMLLFAGMWWGALFNRFRINETRVEIPIENLPEAFDGYRIVQLSDLHTGTFGSDTTFVTKIIEHVNHLHPDVVLFTGDIVNRRSDEMHPFITSLQGFNAPVYAILGNHDYGDYLDWPSPEAKQQNMELLYNQYRRANIDLLRNRSVKLLKDSASIILIGVENIGDPPFPVYGSLSKAYPSVGDSLPKILMSHNPAHWTDSIADHPEINIPLTLSGHTHAMQIELLGISPAALRYPTWGGLYADTSGKHQLYVNIGAGTVGLPMRLGATPEITLITLRRK